MIKLKLFPSHRRRNAACAAEAPAKISWNRVDVSSKETKKSEGSQGMSSTIQV